MVEVGAANGSLATDGAIGIAAGTGGRGVEEPYPDDSPLEPDMAVPCGPDREGLLDR
jgi:hypothetical protein